MIKFGGHRTFLSKLISARPLTPLMFYGLVRSAAKFGSYKALLRQIDLRMTVDLKCDYF